MIGFLGLLKLFFKFKTNCNERPKLKLQDKVN